MNVIIEDEEGRIEATFRKGCFCYRCIEEAYNSISYRAQEPNVMYLSLESFDKLYSLVKQDRLETVDLTRFRNCEIIIRTNFPNNAILFVNTNQCVENKFNCLLKLES